jgi:hypothetical protein
MSTFDESKHPRNRGKFSAVPHREPEVTIRPGFDARYWGLPEWRPGSWVFGATSCAEIVAGSVLDGPLSRGPARKDSIESFHRWRSAAAGHGTAEGEDFAAGLEDGLRVLTGSGADKSTAEVIASAATDPTSPAARTNWLLGLRAAPSRARYRGNLAAGVILSGADEWWGIRDDLDLAVNGPAQDTPRARGAWSSLAGKHQPDSSPAQKAALLAGRAASQ